MTLMIQSKDLGWEERSALLADALASMTDSLTDEDVARLACHFSAEASSREGDHHKSVAICLGANAARPDPDLRFEVAAALRLGLIDLVLEGDLRDRVKEAIDPLC